MAREERGRGETKRRRERERERERKSEQVVKIKWRSQGRKCRRGMVRRDGARVAEKLPDVLLTAVV